MTVREAEKQFGVSYTQWTQGQKFDFGTSWTKSDYERETTPAERATSRVLAYKAGTITRDELDALMTLADMVVPPKVLSPSSGRSTIETMTKASVAARQRRARQQLRLERFLRRNGR